MDIWSIQIKGELTFDTARIIWAASPLSQQPLDVVGELLVALAHVVPALFPFPGPPDESPR